MDAKNNFMRGQIQLTQSDWTSENTKYRGVNNHIGGSSSRVKSPCVGWISPQVKSPCIGWILPCIKSPVADPGFSRWHQAMTGCNHFCTWRRRCSELVNVMGFSQGVQKGRARCEALADPKGTPGMHPLGVQILSFSCSFRGKKLQKNRSDTPTSGVGIPLRRILDLPLQNRVRAA